MKTRLYFSLSVLTIVALFLLPAAVEAVPLPGSLGNQPAIVLDGSENLLSSANENIPDANITVTTLEDELNSDGDCSLREVIQAANTDVPVDECPAGAWPATDTISFSVGGTIALSFQLEVTSTGPLVIDGTIGITISGGNSVQIFSLSNTALLTLLNLSLINGNATEGGAIKNLSSLTLWDTTISGSHATGASTGGGGIYNYGTLTIYNSTLSGNEASSGSGRGGAIYNNLGTVYLTNTTLSGNHSVNDGGGIYNQGTLYLANATLSNNSAGDTGGGIYAAGYSVYLRNSILAKNTAVTDGPDCYASNINSNNYNLVGKSQGCAMYPRTGDMIGVDPRLGPLQDNGGPTFTHQLLPSSLAINHGNPTSCVAWVGYWVVVDIDQRGFDRSDRCDIGAFELQPEPAAGPYSLFLPFVMRSCSNRLFFDDFSQHAYGWNVGEYNYGSYDYINGEYRILAKNFPGTDTWVGSFSGNKYTDYILEVDVRNVTGAHGHYGLFFEWKEDWSHYYVFLIDSTYREYVIFRFPSLTPDPYLSHGYSSSIRAGTATNHLRLERNGNQIWAYANGELLTSFREETTAESRYVGLFNIAHSAASIDARFDNFTVEPISCGASYNYPVLAGDALDEAAVELAPPEGWESASHILVTGP